MDENFMNFFENEEERIKNSLAAYIRKSLNCSTTELLQSEAYINLKAAVMNEVIAAGKSKEFGMCIFNEIDKTTGELEKKGASFKDILPKGFENNLKVYLYNNSPAIISEIKKAVRNKNTEKRIKLEINKFAGSLNPMIAKFVNADNVYIKIVQGIDNYFNSAESSMEFVEAASKLIDSGMCKEIKGVTMYFPYEGRKSIIEALRDTIINVVFQERVIDEILSYFENILKGYESFYALFLKCVPNLEEVIQEEAQAMFNYIKSN